MKKTWRIAPPLVLATTLHAMVLTGVVQWRGSEAGGGDGHASVQTASLSVRVTPSAAALPAQWVAPPQEAAEAAGMSAPLSSDVSDAPDASEVPDTAAPAQALPITPLAATAVAADAAPKAVADLSVAAPAAATLATSLGATEAAATNGAPDQDPDRYHARRELSRPPKALSAIDIIFPPGVPTPGRHKAVLAVYIDELGQVRKVRTEGEALPLAFEDAARNAFLSAQFRAGELDGRIVKSYILVEVVFDEQPEARGLAVSSLGQGGR